jgi:hypothetical protein
MEALTRLVADSLARHGFDRPVDPRRLQWSRWSRCDSPHSLLVVPSKPGIFALAEEVLDLDPVHGGTDALVRPAEPSSAVVSSAVTAVGSALREGHDFSPAVGVTEREGHDFSRAVMPARTSPALAAEVNSRGRHDDQGKRMLAVLQFSEDDDMAFTLDRMFTRINPMRARLASGRCFLRFVVIEDQAQRRNICNALNQWMLSSVEKATGIPSDFSTSLELASVGRTCPEMQSKGPSPATADSSTARVSRTLLSDSAGSTHISAMLTKPAPEANFATAPPHLDSGAARNLHCPHPLPSGF